MQLLYWSETDATLNIYLPFDTSVCIYLILSVKTDLALVLLEYLVCIPDSTLRCLLQLIK